MNWKHATNMIGYKKSILERWSFSDEKIGRCSSICKKFVIIQEWCCLIKHFEDLEYLIIGSRYHDQTKSKISFGCPWSSGTQEVLQWKQAWFCLWLLVKRGSQTVINMALSQLFEDVLMPWNWKWAKICIK